MTTWSAWLVLIGPLAYVAAALLARREPGRRPTSTIVAGTAASWIAVAVAAVAGIATAVNGRIESTTVGIDGLGASVRLDGLSTVMLLMIALLAVVIFRYSCRYLEGDDRHGTFLGWLAATIAAVQILVISGNLGLLVVAWVATSLALHRLLLFYPERWPAVVAARKKFLVARTGDALLVVAALLLWRHAGSGNLEAVFRSAASAPDDAAVVASAILLVLAAGLKSAQFPTHGWLVEVMETPTPVSALLHAGILNAGPFLIIRMAYVVDQVDAATLLLIAMGATTALLASVMLLTQPSVKVALGYSSAAHMGFMLMICGTGVYAAALLHLVAHSFYKAHAFLSSGSAIDEARAAKVRLPQRLGSAVRVAASAGIAVALYLLFAAAWGIDLLEEPVLAAIGAMLVLGTTQIVAPALDSDGRGLDVLRAAGLALAVTAAFFALEAGAHHLLYDAVPHDGDRSVLHLASIGAVLLAFAGVIGMQIFHPARGGSPRRTAIAIHVRNGFYANAAFDRAVGALRRPATPAGAPPTPSVHRAEIKELEPTP